MRPLLALVALCLCAALRTTAQAPPDCAARHGLLAPTVDSPPDPRSDSLDLLHTSVWLDLSDEPQLSGRATIALEARLDGVHGLVLDLEGLTVDSVWFDGQPVAFSYTSPQLRLTFPAALTTGATHNVAVRYHGQPVIDASNWGGFYFQSGYAYNLGVGFAADPHSFGRAWFPCFDNFVERCPFEFRIVTEAAKPAWCNGMLQSDVPLPGGRRERHWVLTQPIPSYLASVASGPYVGWQRNYGGIPVEIAAAAGDTNKVAASFVHLPHALACYQHWFGPDQWPRVGYSLVPFNAGAMEHATNIAIMRSAINGTTANESLWAHELSHHWWGDLATCTGAEDMWLNEGWAVYSEHLLKEWLDGAEAYRAAVEANFLNVLEKTHVEEGGYRAVSGLPHNLTYGQHTYNKGAVVAHNLRGYLGDSLFRHGIRQALAETSFSDWSSAELREKLEAATGQDLTSFFENWVFSPGFADFSVDSFHAAPQPQGFEVTVFVKQKRRGAPAFFTDVPLEFTFVSAAGERLYARATVGGETATATFALPFAPAYVWLDTRQRLTLARAERERVLTAAGSYVFAPAKLDVALASAVDSLLLRIEHHFARPDTGDVANPAGYVLTNRYWTVAGAVPADLPATGTVFYDGRGQLDQLDAELFDLTGMSEDSLVLLYRPGAGQAWTIHPDYIQNTLGSANNTYGFFRFKLLAAGEYTIARAGGTVAASEPDRDDAGVVVTPNPVRGDTTFRVRAQKAFQYVRLTTSAAQVVDEWQLADPATEAELRFSRPHPAGAYWLTMENARGKKQTKKLVIIP
jgi:hypothetical protein